MCIYKKYWRVHVSFMIVQWAKARHTVFMDLKSPAQKNAACKVIRVEVRFISLVSFSFSSGSTLAKIQCRNYRTK